MCPALLTRRNPIPPRSLQGVEERERRASKDASKGRGREVGIQWAIVHLRTVFVLRTEEAPVKDGDKEVCELKANFQSSSLNESCRNASRHIEALEKTVHEKSPGANETVSIHSLIDIERLDHTKAISITA